MSQDNNLRIAQVILAAVGAKEDPDAIAQHFAEDVVFEVQGDDGVLPWIGKQKGRQSVADFFRGTRELVNQERVDIEDMMASDQRAVIVGRLASVIKSTNRRIETDFALVMTIKGEIVTRFQMFEDSFLVSVGARP